MNKKIKIDEDYIKSVQSDHYAHKFVLFSVAAYGFQLHGWLTGIGILLGLIIIIAITNSILMATASDQNVFRLIRVNRWGWIIVTAAILVVSSATIESA